MANFLWVSTDLADESIFTLPISYLLSPVPCFLKETGPTSPTNTKVGFSRIALKPLLTITAGDGKLAARYKPDEVFSGWMP